MPEERIDARAVCAVVARQRRRAVREAAPERLLGVRVNAGVQPLSHTAVEHLLRHVRGHLAVGHAHRISRSSGEWPGQVLTNS